jgi:hypothetical protein
MKATYNQIAGQSVERIVAGQLNYAVAPRLPGRRK